METKAFWKSKTFWVNVFALIVMIIQTQTGFVISLEEQAGGLAVVNVILRIITKEALSWS